MTASCLILDLVQSLDPRPHELVPFVLWIRVDDIVYTSYFLSRKGTLIINMRWIIANSLGSSFNDLLKTCLPLKLFLTASPCLFLDSRITPTAQPGLVPYQNHIKSLYDPYMGHPPSKNWTLDFSLRFDFPLSPRSLFHTRQRFLLSNHVTSGCLSP